MVNIKSDIEKIFEKYYLSYNNKETRLKIKSDIKMVLNNHLKDIEIPIVDINYNDEIINIIFRNPKTNEIIDNLSDYLKNVL